LPAEILPGYGWAVLADARIVLVIPAFDEGRSLPGLLEDVAKAGVRWQVVVVDDGSSDDTAAAAQRGGAQVLRHPFNMGYGAALQTGYKYALAAGADFLVQMDADGQHLPSELPRLLEPVQQGECDLVIGSRFLAESGYRMGFLRSLGRAVFRGLARLWGLQVTDPTSGLQAMNRRVLMLFATDLYPNDFPDVDVLLLAHRRGLRIQERPVRMAASWRPSTLHSGWAPLYYCYKMLLALWALSGVPRRAQR
jgi:glycosyltransferase involved in cell wall biosynthesis